MEAKIYTYLTVNSPSLCVFEWPEADPRNRTRNLTLTQLDIQKEMKLKHPSLVKSLQKAYSAERAASYAYIGHAGSVKDREEKRLIQQIEQDEWDHRRHVLAIMQQYDIPVSKYYECKYLIVGKCIGFSCYLIGRFMPFFFAGKLRTYPKLRFLLTIRRRRGTKLHQGLV